LPDIVGELQSRITELQIDGSEPLLLGYVDGSLDELADHPVDLGTKLLHDRFDAFFARLLGRCGSSQDRHGRLLR
jgi:hypothetical protein